VVSAPLLSFRSTPAHWPGHRTQLPRHQQLIGLEACQCRVSQAMERHVALVLLAFVVLQQLRLDPSETGGEVKRRLHLSVIRGDLSTSGAIIASLEEGKTMAAA